MTWALKLHDRLPHNGLKKHQHHFWIFIIKNRRLKTTQICEISLNKTIKWRRSFYTNIFCYHSPSNYIWLVVFGNLSDQTVPTSSADMHIYMKISLYLNKHILTKTICLVFLLKAQYSVYCFFPLRAIPHPPRCRLSCPTGGVQLSAPRGDTNTRGSSETRVAPESRPAHVSPLALLPWLAIKGSAGTSTLTWDWDRNVV